MSVAIDKSLMAPKHQCCNRPTIPKILDVFEKVRAYVSEVISDHLKVSIIVVMHK